MNKFLRLSFVKDFKTIMEKVLDERIRQLKKWGEQDHRPEWWMNILLEEIGEASKALLERDPEKFRTELIQSAAVIMATIESFDRQGKEINYNGGGWAEQTPEGAADAG